jgi:NAD(P)H-dependent FMN reductase
MKIAVIVGSIRDSRVTARLANWVYTHAKELHPEVEFSLVDIRDYELPFVNEDPWDPNRTLTEGTKAWLQAVADADGYVVVTAEHNHGMPAPLKNALDLTNDEMSRKPAAIVSHGSVGGARANEQLRLVLNSSIGAMPVPHSVTFFGKVTEGVKEDGSLEESFALNNKKLREALDELIWYMNALRNTR